MKEKEEPEQPQVSSEEIKAPLNVPIENKEESQKKKDVNKTGMCQIIYYDFSLK